MNPFKTGDKVCFTDEGQSLYSNTAAWMGDVYVVQSVEYDLVFLKNGKSWHYTWLKPFVGAKYPTKTTSVGMTQEQYLQFHQEFTAKMFSITKAKNSDYTGGGEDAFANFSAIEEDGITDTVRGFMVRMRDKWSRLCSFVKLETLQVKDESVEDTLMDLANYCILLAAYLKSRKDDNEVSK